VTVLTLIVLGLHVLKDVQIIKIMMEMEM